MAVTVEAEPVERTTVGREEDDRCTLRETWRSDGAELRQSSRASVRRPLAKTEVHSCKGRLEVTTVPPFSWRSPRVGGSPGTVVNTGPQGVVAGLRILANGGEIDYEGASGSLDWDGNGDLDRGHAGVLRFTAGERIEEVGSVAFFRA